MGSTSGHTRKGLSLSRGLFLVFGYFVSTSVLGLAIGFATIRAFYRGVVEWHRPAVAAALSLAVMTLCWSTMPANRPHMGMLILRVALVANLAVGAFVARHVLLGPGPVRGDEICVLIITTAAFAIGVWLDRGTRWRRRWSRRRAR